MKKKYLLLMLAGALLTGCGEPETTATTYTKEMVVVIATKNARMFRDEMGYFRQVIGSNHRCKEGDVCTVLMSDNGTPDNVFDDVILE